MTEQIVDVTEANMPASSDVVAAARSAGGAAGGEAAALALDGLSQRVDALAGLDASDRVIVVGDSWTDVDDGGNATWLTTALDDVVGSGRWASYGVGGSTLDQIAGQFDRVLEDFSGREATVGTVIAVGGINDVRRASDAVQVSQAAKRFGNAFGSFASRFPNAHAIWLVDCYEPRLGGSVDSARYDLLLNLERQAIIGSTVPVGLLSLVFNCPSYYLDIGDETSFHLRHDGASNGLNWRARSLVAQVVASGTYRISDNMTLSNMVHLRLGDDPDSDYTIPTMLAMVDVAPTSSRIMLYQEVLYANNPGDGPVDVEYFAPAPRAGDLPMFNGHFVLAGPELADNPVLSWNACVNDGVIGAATVASRGAQKANCGVGMSQLYLIQNR